MLCFVHVLDGAAYSKSGGRCRRCCHSRWHTRRNWAYTPQNKGESRSETDRAQVTRHGVDSDAAINAANHRCMSSPAWKHGRSHARLCGANCDVCEHGSAGVTNCCSYIRGCKPKRRRVQEAVESVYMEPFVGLSHTPSHALLRVFFLFAWAMFVRIHIDRITHRPEVWSTSVYFIGKNVFQSDVKVNVCLKLIETKRPL